MGCLTHFTVAYTFCAGLLLWVLECVLPSVILNLYTFVACALLNLIVIYYSFSLFKELYFMDRVLPHKKAVLITGCDSGFGHELAKRLDSKGYHVFASCLFPDGEGASELKKTCSSSLDVIGLDVTKDESVQNALNYVQKNLGNSELWAVVNNAGVAHGFSVSWSKLECFQKCLDVNTLGPVRVTKAFLPLLKRSRGRVVTVASIAGRIASPHLTPYTMSKFAVAALNDCLRLELQPWGIKVISIEPESFKTGIARFDVIKRGLDGLIQGLDEDTMGDYGGAYFRAFEDYIKFFLHCFSEDVYVVVDSMENAISLEQPNDTYQPCRNILSTWIVRIIQNLPRPVLERIIRLVMYITGFPVPKEAENLL